MGSENMKWKQIPYNGLSGGNSLLECNGFSISYNPNPGSGFSLFSGDGGCNETALCIPRGDGSRKFLILNGDFRDEYEKLAPSGIHACIEFFKSKKEEHGSSWTSRDWEENSSLNETATA